ncbi:MAG: hypothetical protein E7050_11680 [Lentisphaerae bacterium]|nr:hypothetical protein [Lentisphaerota bacterium]
MQTKKWSQLSDDVCGEPERSEGNRQQVNGLPLTCVKKRKPKKSQLVADFYRFDFFASKKMEPIIGIDKEGKARRSA